MRLHRHVCVQMVQCTISLFTPIPSTFVHTLNFFVTATWALMLLGTGNWDERVYLFKINQLHLSLLLEEWKGHMSRPNEHYLSRIATGDSRTRPASGNREYETNRSSRSGVRTRQTMVTRLRISMRPFRARIHLRRRWGRVTLILSHVMALRLVGRVGGRIGRAGSRD